MVGFIPNCYRDQKMCNKAIDNYTWFGPNCYSTQKMFSNVVGTYSSAIQFVGECYKTSQMFNKAIDTCPFMFMNMFVSWILCLCKININIINIIVSYYFYVIYMFLELMPERWHPTKWWDWCVLEDVKKK